jgi:hypothetical protein
LGLWFISSILVAASAAYLAVVAASSSYLLWCQYACHVALPASADSFSSSSLMARHSATMIFSLDAFFPVNSTKISTTWLAIVNNINSKNF